MTTEKLVVRAGLAGAAALAGGTGAYGAIVNATATLPADVLIGAGVNITTLSATWDVNGDAAADFQFRYRSNISAAWEYSAQMLFAAGASGVNNGVPGGYGPYADLLTNGSVVGPASAFGTARLVLGSNYGGTTYGDFGTLAGSQRGFVGFKFLAVDGTHFGWVELEVFSETDGSGAGTTGIKFYAAAYESTPDTAITIGPVPAPGSIGALALGAVALLRRKQRAA